MFDKQKLNNTVTKVTSKSKQIVSIFNEPTEAFSQKWLSVMLFCAIFVSKDILYFGTVNASLLRISQIVMMGCALFSAIYLLKNKISVKDKSIFSLIILTVLVVLSAIGNLDFRMGYLYLLVVLWVGYMLMWIAGADGIFDFFYKAMTVISVVSVVAFVFQKLSPQFVTLFPIIKNETGIQFRFLLITNLDDTHGTFLRNWGPFREPGVFQAFVALSLMYGLYHKKQASLWSILFHILAIVTTFSTTGYIVLLLIIGASVVQKKETMLNRELYKIILVICLLGVLYLAFFTDLLYSTGEMDYASVFGKIFSGGSNLSMGSRVASIWVNILMFLEHPVFGGGLTFVDAQFDVLCNELYGFTGYHNTNTVFILLSTYGLIFMTILIAKLWLFVNEYFHGGRLTKLLLLVAYLCLLFGENLMYSVIIMLPLFYVSEIERKQIMKLKEFLKEKLLCIKYLKKDNDQVQ